MEGRGFGVSPQPLPAVPIHGTATAFVKLLLARSSRLEIEPYQDPFSIRKIADDFLDWRRKPAYQCGNSDDLVASGQLRAAQQIDDLDAVPSAHIGLAYLLQIAECRNGIGGVPGDIKAELPSDDFRRRYTG